MFSNEPGPESNGSNSELVPYDYPIYKKSNKNYVENEYKATYLYPRFALKATRDIKKGEEITWCYGRDLKDYPVHQSCMDRNTHSLKQRSEFEVELFDKNKILYPNQNMWGSKSAIFNHMVFAFYLDLVGRFESENLKNYL